MSEEKKYYAYTAADIEKYHKGLLSSGEMHELEKAALDDPFLADALEGFGAITVSAASDLSELEKKLEERISGTKVISIAPARNSFKWRKVAAAVVIIGGLGFLTYRLSTGSRNGAIARLEEKKSNQRADTVIGNSIKPAIPDSIAVTSTGKPAKKKTTATSKEKTSAKHLYPVKDTNDFVSAFTNSDASIASNFKEEKNDSTKVKNANGYAAAPAKAKKTEMNNAQAEGIAPAINEKQMTLRDQKQVNYFRGRVADANNNPLPFANITNTRDNVGTYADAHGNFTLISPDSALDVQVRSVGFESGLTRLKNNVTTNQVVLQDDKTLPDKIISFQKPNADRSRTANMKFEESEPEPADGWDNYGTYLVNNINVPDDLKMKHDRGQVQLSFDVSQNGDPVNIKIEKSLCGKCDEEAIRLIREGPKWKKKNKKAKRVTVTVPFDALH